MGEVIDRRAADIHPHIAGIDRLEPLLAAGQRVVELERHLLLDCPASAHRKGRGCNAAETKPRCPMPDEGIQYRSPMILQLFKNREVQLAAEAQDNPERVDQRPEFFPGQPPEGDYGSVMEWIGVFLQVFWLALLSGGFLLILTS